ncbi:MAG: asparagine--tRNA ligase [Puniceicoccales bacterium]|jgi:asparaginyl-tRNA synthetase|nr:asparagine--tRNA ligase [Puniceicoccales bacterium]
MFEATPPAGSAGVHAPKRTLVRDLLAAGEPCDAVLAQGWVRTRRDAKGFSFVEVNDGSSLKGIQVIVKSDLPDYAEQIHRASTGASVEVRGALVPSQGAGQRWEIVAGTFNVIGTADATFPLQKKGHSLEFLREIAHLRARSNLFGAVFRVRSRLAFAIHEFFQRRGFFYVHTPIITASDCEGAGEMFGVSTLDPANPPRDDTGAVDYSRDFFGKKTSLTVSGQLEGETLACALSNIYTFGPTFRAENSNTSRHAAEFWMVEPEAAFLDLDGDMQLAEDFVKHLVRDAREHCADELEFFAKFVDKDLLPRLDFVLERPFQRCSYTDAIGILERAAGTGAKAFESTVAWGDNLQSEHERFLSEEHFKCPVTVFNYPRSLKPFYMKVNAPDALGRETVRAMDLLVPGIGEIIGGSQREERLDVLLDNMARQGLCEADYRWYVDLRRYGTVPHSGFGLGFERMLMFVTGVSNIRDVIPYPRTPKNAEF